MPLPPFQTLLDAHGRDVHRFLAASLGPVDADDCFQETWLSALRAYPRLTDAANLRAWVFTIAHRKLIDHVRARRRRATPTADAERLAAATAAPTAAEHDAQLWRRVATLPPKQRTAVTLRFVVDCDHAEIAAVMGTSPEAARRSVHEGLKRLRKELEDDAR